MFTKFWDPKTARVLFTALIFAIVLAFLHGASETLTLFLFAILFEVALVIASAVPRRLVAHRKLLTPIRFSEGNS